jgi:hypothetical protein
MPRSKLGLKLPVEKILQKKQCNPVALLAEMVMERDKDGKWVLEGRDRLMALRDLVGFLKPKPKAQEVVAEHDRKIEINRLTFTMPPPANGTVIKEVKANEGDAPA